MNETRATPPANVVGEVAAEFMDYLAEMVPSEAGTKIESVLVAAWTDEGIFWRIDSEAGEDGDSEADEDGVALAKLAIALADAALSEASED